MPYIPKEDRVLIDSGEADPVSYGELNYAITKLCMEFLGDIQGELEMDGETIGYEYYNNVIGVLECVKQELYRRVVAKYESEAMERNGDVY